MLMIILVGGFWIVVISTAVRFVRKFTGRKQETSPEARLKKLDQLKNGSLITDQEYTEQRKRIISEV